MQSGNRTHIFNAAYSIELGNPVRNNKIAGGFVNGWQLSGITQLESGPNLTGIQNQNFGMNLNGYKIPGSISAKPNRNQRQQRFAARHALISSSTRC